MHLSIRFGGQHSEDEDSWEPLTHLSDCAQAIADFHAELGACPVCARNKQKKTTGASFHQFLVT